MMAGAEYIAGGVAAPGTMSAFKNTESNRTIASGMAHSEYHAYRSLNQPS
jgi:hypothetical protein